MSMTLLGRPLDVNLAVALRIWSGRVTHTCWAGEVVLSGLRI